MLEWFQISTYGANCCSLILAAFFFFFNSQISIKATHNYFEIQKEILLLPALQTMNYVSLFAAIISQHSFSKDIKTSSENTGEKKKKKNNHKVNNLLDWSNLIKCSCRRSKVEIP